MCASRCHRLSALFILAVAVPLSVSAYEGNNSFKPDIFPYPTSNRSFSIPLDPGKTVVIVPASLASQTVALSALLEKKCGRSIPIFSDNAIDPAMIPRLHLIVLGNIVNNRYALDLYNRRQAFADAYFPGKGGIVIHPTTSIWNYEFNVLVIGVSYDNDLIPGFEAFVGLLHEGADAIPALHLLKTDLAFPKPPGNVDSIIENIRTNFMTFPSWSSIPYWGLCYYLSGDTAWAELFRKGCRALYERAQTSGRWIPESWTTLYYELWRYFRVWRLLDEDPIFIADDRRIVENLLWAYTWFLYSDDNYPYYTAENRTFGIRQNHTSFHALSMFYAHQYFKEKYGLMDLDGLAAKYEPIFDGQARSYRSNDDDAYGYMYYAPHQTLMYQLMRGGDSYIREKLETLADLAVTVIDNRRDDAGFGDVSYYTHRAAGSQRWLDIVFPSMAAWRFGDGQYKWWYDWMTGDAAFTFDNLYYGDYAVDIGANYPDRFLGVHPVLLDDGALEWIACRTERDSYLPTPGRDYVDKMSMRRSFDPQDEYLLLDGTSIFAHGHQDGNTISRLTWKDRIWLFDMDYIKLTPRYHNGVIVVRDGVQEAPPPLTSLDFRVDFNDAGMSRTTNVDYNGADWERTIVWKKGRYFLFLDRITAREEGDYRLESRWRTRGDVSLGGNNLCAVQGGPCFFISCADDAVKDLLREPDTSLSAWNYPYGDGAVQVLYARKDIRLDSGGAWSFVSLMQAAASDTAPVCSISKTGDDAYLIAGDSPHFAHGAAGGTAELAGLDPSVLEKTGLFTDARVFLLDDREVRLVGATRVMFDDVSLTADNTFHLAIRFRENAGELMVLGAASLELDVRGCRIDGGEGTTSPDGRSGIRLRPGRFSVKFTRRADALTQRTGSKQSAAGAIASLMPGAHTVNPGRKKTAVRNFDIRVMATVAISDTVTAFCRDGAGLLCGDRKGAVSRFANGKSSSVLGIPSKLPITALHTYDVDGDGVSDILAGDTGDSLYAYSGAGERLWSLGMTRFYGANANAVDIATADAAIEGAPAVFVATNGFKLYGIGRDGTVKWETLIRYHPQTKVGFLRNGPERYVPVGTVYSTPLNVVDPASGATRWYTWEQVGDESKSTTDYCGIDLTAMVFIDTDGDSARDIVFGTRSNTVHALNAADGKTKWMTNVGSEVTAMHAFDDPVSGQPRIAVATEAGDLYLLDRSGRRVGSAALTGPIAAIDVVTGTGRVGTVIVAATTDGGVTVLDGRLRLRAFRSYGDESLRGIVIVGKTGDSISFYTIAADTVHLNSFTAPPGRTSRFH